MAKMLLLRSSDGKVLVAPAWDKRPSAATPLETGVPSRALERVVQFWTKHALAKSTGESRESLARWDADFERRLEEDGLTAEAAAAVRLFRLNGIHHGGRPRAAKPSESGAAVPATTAADPAVHVWCRPVGPAVRAATATPSDAAAAAAARADLAVAWCAAAGADPATALRAAGADPVDVWCSIHGGGAEDSQHDRAAGCRARGRRQRAEDDEEPACHHRKRALAISRAIASKTGSSVGSAPRKKAACKDEALDSNTPVLVW